MKILAFVRSTIFWIVFTISILIGETIYFIFVPFVGYKARYKIVKTWLRVVVWCMKWICGVDYSVKNLDVLKEKGPLILLSKHQSGWDPMGLVAISPRRLNFVYKKELHKVPVFGWGLAFLGMLSIDRAHGREAFDRMKARVPQYLKSDWVLAVFPEGTRTAPGTTIKYKSGGARIAIDTNTPVIPAALNSGECWPKHSFLIYPGKIQIVFGDKISPEGKTVAALNMEVQDWVENQMRIISPKFYPPQKD